MLNLRYFPDPVLLRKADPVAVFDDALRAKAAEMAPLMELERGIGLAAPQAGWGVRLLLARPDEGGEIVTLVNPEIVKKKGGVWGEEGCLSFPGIYGDVLRAETVRVRAADLSGRVTEFDATDLYARVLQHEIDHLDGVLFVTKMRPTDRKAAQKKLDELKARFEASGPAGVREA